MNTIYIYIYIYIFIYIYVYSLFHISMKTVLKQYHLKDESSLDKDTNVFQMNNFS